MGYERVMKRLLTGILAAATIGLGTEVAAEWTPVFAAVRQMHCVF